MDFATSLGNSYFVPHAARVKHRRFDPAQRARPLLHLAALLALMLASGILPAPADPASTIQTLMIVDQGNFLSFQWSFYFVDFPSSFVLDGTPPQTVTLNDPPAIYDNVAKIVASAFDLKLDGKSIAPDKISPLTISPNKVCTVTMIYRGRPGAHIELRAPVLHYLPPQTIINYEILTLGHASDIVTGNLTAQPGPFAKVIDYRQTTSPGDASLPATESADFAFFKAQLRTPWINPNWLLTILVLLLVLPPRRAAPLLAGLALIWIATCALSTLANLRLPWTLPPLVLALPTALLGIVAARAPRRWSWLLALALIVATLNACADLQQLRWFNQNRTPGAALALCGGFLTSYAVVVLVEFALIVECKKYREFEAGWAPTLCWIVAAAALILPLQQLISR